MGLMLDRFLRHSYRPPDATDKNAEGNGKAHNRAPLHPEGVLDLFENDFHVGYRLLETGTLSDCPSFCR